MSTEQLKYRRVCGGLKLHGFIGIILLLLSGSCFATPLSENELNSFLKDTRLRNTWFMYSAGDGHNYTYSIGKSGKVLPVDSAFCSTRQGGAHSSDERRNHSEPATSAGESSLRATSHDLAPHSMKQMPLLTAAALWLSPLSETNATKPQAVKQASKS